jgi:hypothetical protein
MAGSEGGRQNNDDTPMSVLDSNDNINSAWHDFIEQSHLISQPTVTSGGTSSAVITCTSSNFFGSTFATSAVHQSFEISQPLAGNLDSVLLGLQDAGNNAIPTPDVLSAFGVIDLSDLPRLVYSMITVLQTKVGSMNILPTFKVDTSIGAKNGLWLVAIDSSTLEVSLCHWSLHRYSR